MTQTNLFSETLISETAAFHAACRARNAHDFFTAEYAAAQTEVDVRYERVRTLQACVPHQEWAL